MGALLLGPFMIKHIYIVLLFAGLASYFTMKKSANIDPLFQKLFINTIINAALIWFVLYKFSVIIFQPFLFFENPFSIIYFTGGAKGAVLGVLVAISYLFIVIRKEKWSLKAWISSIFYGIVTFIIIFWSVRTLLVLID